MNTLKTLTLALMLIIFSVTGLRAEEMSLEPFANDFFTALQAQDYEKIGQLFIDNPNTAKALQQSLTILGKGTGKRAEQYRALAGLVGKMRQALSDDEDDNSSALNRLQKEGKEAYYAADYPTALEKWQLGLEKAQELGDKSYISQFLGNIGAVYLNLGQYPKALDAYQQALAIDKELGDKRAISQDFTDIGHVYNRLGQYPKALDSYQHALAIAKEIGDKRGIGHDLTGIGVVYNNLGQYSKALDAYQHALAIYQELGYKRGIGNSLANIGVVYDNLGQYPKALDFLKQALAIKKELGDKRGIGNNLTNTGVVYDHLGQYNQALDSYQHALAIHQEIGDKRGEGADLSNIGLVYDNLGQYPKALDSLKQSLAIKKEIGDKHGIGNSLTNIGVVYRNLGQAPKALESYQQALAIHIELGDKRGIAHDLINIGAVYYSLGQYPKALDAYRQALAIHQELGEKRGQGNNLTNIGVVYKNLGQYSKALDAYQQALAIDKEIGNKRGIGHDLTNIGVLYKTLGEYQKAKKAFQESLAIKIAIGSGETWKAQRGLAFAEAKLNQFEAAITHYEQAIDNIEKVRSSLTKEHKTSFMQDKLYVYDELIALLQSLHLTQPEKGYDRKALEIFERKQGRVFLEEMGQSGARLFVGLPKEILEGELSLEKQLAQTHQQLADEQAKPVAAIAGEVVQDKALIKTLEQRRQQLQNELDALQEQIRTEYPDYYALKYPQPAQLDTLQKEVLRDGELMLVYAVMKDSTTLWAIAQQTFEMFDLSLGESALSKQVAQLRALIGTDDKTRGARVRRRSNRKRQADPFAKASYELYTQLIPEQVRPLLAVPYTVYVIPTGPLYALPFETLVTHKPSDSKDIHYLIEDVPIAYLSSASLLKILREAQQRRQDTARYPFLAFANPVYEAEQTSDVSKTSEVLALRSESYRAIRGGEFAELPETEDEAKEIAALLNASTDSEPLQLGEAASRQTVFQLNDQKRLDDYQTILFATHRILPGEVDRVTQAALVLSHPDTKGYLTMADVFGLQLNAKLVSLSACNTGGGKKVRGEGVMGLTRAFMYAGTPAIAVTLWSVESYSAKTLSVGFFKQFNDIQKPAAALRAIKLRMLRGSEGQKYKRPYYWAPFVVYGDAQFLK